MVTLENEHIDFFTLIVGVVGIALYIQGPTTLWSAAEYFYGPLIVPFLYIIVMWLILLSHPGFVIWRQERKHMGLISYSISLFALSYGLLTVMNLYIVRLPSIMSLNVFLLSWFINTLLTGVVVLLFGLVSYKVNESDKRVDQIGQLRRLIYVLTGIFGMLVGILGGVTWTAPIVDYTTIPMMYGTLLVPSILGLIQWRSSRG